MSNIRFFADNLWTRPGGSISATTASLALPPAATQNGDRTYVWRGLPQGGDQTLTRDLGVPFTIAAAALANARPLNGGTIVFEQAGAAAVPGAWSTVAQLSVTDPQTLVAWTTFTAIVARHLRFRFINPIAAPDYPEAGFAFVGTPYEPTVNVRVPMEWSLEDPSVIERAVDGQQTTTERSMYLVGQCEFVGLPLTDLQTFQRIYRDSGIRRPIFMVLDDTLPWSTPLVRLSSPIRQTFSENSRRYDLAFSWEEAR